jgi:integrase
MASSFLCTAPGCDKPVPEKNEEQGYFCNDHLRRWTRYGDPLAGKPHAKHGEMAAWIKAHVSYSGIGCLIWPFSRHQQGYPSQVSDGDDRKRATRIMCELAHGPAPTPEHQAAHGCHNGHLGCIHPQHLHWVTNAENAAESAAMRRDAVVRGVPAKRTSRSGAKVLTVKGVEGAERRATRYELADASLPNFYLSVMPSGHKSFVLRYRFNGQSRKLTIGSHPQITLQAARKAARDALARVAMGHDPAAEKKTARLAPAPSTPLTVDDLVEKFLARHVASKCRPGTAAFYERVLKKHVLPEWQGRRADAIDRTAVRLLVEEIADSGRPVAANRTLTTLSSMFGWAVSRGLLAASPADHVDKPATETARQRVLSSPELRLVIGAAGKLPRLESDFVMLLILTLARRTEVAGMTWNEIDLDGQTWTLPGDRAKNGHEHTLPLSTAAMAILKARHRDRDGSPFVFPWRGGKAFKNFSRLKARLDALVTQANGGPIEPWTFHDLRRSGASVMPSLGVNLAVTERILNHISGSFGGIVSVYQKYNYLPEMREAMTKWADHLADKVIQFRRRA